MHLHAYLRSAAEILSLYKGDGPFAAWLKTYFREHKKFGSRDRRFIADLCFCYFRLGFAFDGKSVEEQLLAGQLLCHSESVFVSECKPEWRTATSLPAAEKLRVLGTGESASFFPFLPDVSDAIDQPAFDRSHLVQPDLFLRLRPGHESDVVTKLRNASLDFVQDNDCLRLPNNSKIDGLIETDREAVVQDKSSQQVLSLLPEGWKKGRFSAWDCCAASGGKSILLHDRFPGAAITVSDVRESILHNLRNRFRRAGISRYQSFVADVAAANFSLQKKVDFVLCDAPCSGSGTWGRTPEQLRYFKKEQIGQYASLQKAIALNASRGLAKGGLLLYVTCSVFREENEDVVVFLGERTGLRLESQRYFKGYTEKADTMFAALFASEL